jgi:hypothetical protein
VLELVGVDARVVACVAVPDAVDRAVDGWAGPVLRVAPDEALLLDLAPTDRARGAAKTDAVASAAAAVDDDAVVLDATDGWAAWRLEGDRISEAFARISQIPMPGAFAQGDVANVRAKVVPDGGGLLVLVPSMWATAVAERIVRDCAGLGLRLRPDSAGPRA